MREALWPCGTSVHLEVLDAYFAGRSPVIDALFVAAATAGPVGFLELRIRNYAEGSKQQRVPYIEGVFVKPEYRQQGISSKLFATAENWARERCFNEIASNTATQNLVAQRAHMSFGFREVERSVSYLKKLDS